MVVYVQLASGHDPALTANAEEGEHGDNRLVASNSPIGRLEHLRRRPPRAPLRERRIRQNASGAANRARPNPPARSSGDDLAVMNDGRNHRHVRLLRLELRDPPEQRWPRGLRPCGRRRGEAAPSELARAILPLPARLGAHAAERRSARTRAGQPDDGGDRAGRVSAGAMTRRADRRDPASIRLRLPGTRASSLPAAARARAGARTGRRRPAACAAAGMGAVDVDMEA